MTSLKEVETFWAKVCFDPNFEPQGRFKTYRELVFGGMFDVLQSICPVAKGIVGDAEWTQIIWEYLRASPPQSAILRQLPYEVSQYLKSHDHPFREKYPYLGELMEYEYFEIQVRFAPEIEDSTAPGKIRLTPAHALGHYHWPVHFISETFSDPRKIPRGEFHLLVWRRDDDLEVGYMEVNPLVASLLTAAKPGDKTPSEIIRWVAEENGMALNEEFIQEGQKLIQEMMGKGILLQG